MTEQCESGTHLPAPRVDALFAIADEITHETVRAMSKFPPFNSPHEGWAVVMEEVDEMWDEVKANDLDRSIEEAIQVGAMALRYVLEMRERSAQ